MASIGLCLWLSQRFQVDANRLRRDEPDAAHIPPAPQAYGFDCAAADQAIQYRSFQAEAAFDALDALPFRRGDCGSVIVTRL